MSAPRTDLRLVHSADRDRRREVDREAARIEAEILAYVQREQRRVLAEAGRLILAHLVPVDPAEAKTFWAELRRLDLP